jgi:aquaporin Z
MSEIERSGEREGGARPAQSGDGDAIAEGQSRSRAEDVGRGEPVRREGDQRGLHGSFAAWSLLHELGAETPWEQRFEDPSREWRRLFSELFGTFLLVLAGAGAPVVDAFTHGAIGRGAAVTAPGLTVMAVILFMGAVSGAHLNPAVSVAFAARGDFPWRRVPGYVLVQLLGATLAILLLDAIFGEVGRLGATVPAAGIDNGQALLLELVLCTGLVSTILGTASRSQNVGPLSAVAVGGYIVLAGLWSSPITGASMNPARSFAPDLVLGDFSHYWVYAIGPIAGGLIAVAFAFILRGPGGSRQSAAAAQGTLDEPDKG